MTERKLIVTHHAPDLDAIGATWILIRFDTAHFAGAKFAFVNPGENITLETAEEYGCQLHEVVHVDTGLGTFDHHQQDRALDHNISAMSLVYDDLLEHYKDQKNDQALKEMVTFITEIDHFAEVSWPEPNSIRYNFMLHELLRGFESIEPRDDDSQMHFGLKCLDCVYMAIKEHLKAQEIIESKGEIFEIKAGKCLALETQNDATIKVAQRQGFILVVRKDPEKGFLRVKVRPDSSINLKKLYEAVIKLEPQATWFFHQSGKMLINGSRKHFSQIPSKLNLEKMKSLIISLFA